MSEDLKTKFAGDLKKGGIIATIITFIVSLIVMLLYRFSFICLDPDLCDSLDKPLTINQP
jgi:hypothetical protein